MYQAALMGRRAIGIELKPSYYKQAVQNVAQAVAGLKVQHELDFA